MTNLILPGQLARSDTSFLWHTMMHITLNLPNFWLSQTLISRLQGKINSNFDIEHGHPDSPGSIWTEGRNLNANCSRRYKQICLADL
jgi:hypothetical protein